MIALEREALKQRAALSTALSQFIAQSSASFAEAALDEVVSSRTRQRASEALAGEFEARSSDRKVFQTWTEATIRREERRIHEAKRRKEDNEMGLAMRRVTIEDDDTWCSEDGEEDTTMEGPSSQRRDYQSTDAAVAKVRLATLSLSCLNVWLISFP